MDLSAFRYHPDPIRSGSVTVSDNTCRCCGQQRGYIYFGPTYSEGEDLDDGLCPWCVADGAAHAKFDVIFMDTNEIAGDVPAAVIAELEQRTPGYNSWQQEEWRACCGDAAAFLMPAGDKELRLREFPHVRSGLLKYLTTEEDMAGDEIQELMDSLNRDEGPTAYVFKCLHCGKYLYHVDYP